MRCPSCDVESPEGAKFCLNCGHSLVLTCPECGTELPPQAQFCFSCGAQLGAPLPPTDGQSEIRVLAKAVQRLVPRQFAARLLGTRGGVQPERRVVTILFSDVKGSTAIAEKLDPEDVMEIMDGAFDVLIEPIARYEGTVARLMGDAVLAFFGAPIAHEDDPERACRAALDIVEGAQAYAERLERERGISDFNVRVGIHTGLVVVGAVGTDLRMEYTAMGDAPNLAARLEHAAEPGTVLLSEQTHEFIGSLFETRSLGRITIKGRAEPVSVYRLLAPRPANRKARGVAGLDSPLVGRRAEFSACREALERLRAGVGGILTITGEAGIGKSRLVAELRKGAGPTLGWVEGRCLSYGTSIAYHLWLDVLRDLLGVTADESSEAVCRALQQEVESLCPEDKEAVYPCLARLMSLPVSSGAETKLQDLTGEQLRRATRQAMEKLLACESARRPLVLVCEDLHWADASSLELLEDLMPLVDRTSLLLMCLFRLQTDHRLWHIRQTAARQYPHRHTELRLRPLSMGAGETLLANLLGAEDSLPGPVKRLSQTVRERILGYAEGNPFYVEEIIRSLIDDGAIERDEVTGRWVATESSLDIRVPDTVQGVLMARIDRLPEGPRRVVQMASVIGRIFALSLLAAITDAQADDEVARRLEEHLLTLQREEMIRERARLPEPEYIFKHELTREAAYAGMLKKERQILHREVAVALERFLADRVEEHVELLAHHWRQAGEAEVAVRYLVQAGDRARRLGASREATDHYRLALETAEESGLEAPGPGLAYIHEQLGDVYLEHLSLHPEALHHYGAFLELSSSEDEAARAGRKIATVYLLRGDLSEAQETYEEALARLRHQLPSPETCRVRNCLSHLFLARNQLEEAEEHANASLRIARQVGDTRGRADAHRVMSNIAIHRGDLESACAHDERSLVLYRQLGDLPRIIQACNNVGDTYRLLGRTKQALERLNEGLEVARQIGDTRDEALVLRTKAELFLDQGRWERATATLEGALCAAEKSGAAGQIIESHRLLGSAYERVGLFDQARQHLERAEALMWDSQQFRFASMIHLALAHLNAAEAEFERAETRVQLALEAADSVSSDPFLGQVHHCNGYLEGCRGHWNDAVSHLRKSLQAFERAGLPAGVARARLNLAVAYASRGEKGDRGRACEELLDALTLFRQIDGEGYVAQVDRWLQKLDCRRQDTAC